MSYYQPFYYPYFSARAELPPSLLPLDRKYPETLALPAYPDTALLHEEARRIELDTLTRTHYARAELDRMNEERRIEAEVDAQMELKRETNYLQRIAELRRERELLEIARRPELSARERYDLEAKEKQATRESYMTDEELLRQYATGQKYTQYQREVKDRLDLQPPPNPRPNAIAAKLTYSHETENSPHRIERKGEGQQQYKASERKVEQRGRERSSQQEKERAAEAFKRSYIDELNDSKGHSIEKNSNYLKPRGETLDVLPQSQIDMPFLQHRYGPAPKNKKRKSNQSVSRAPKKKQNKDISLLATNSNRTFTAATATEAMKKINNRLKVSAIVYKDSKLRNQRHEIDHLFNTFQVELKGRKEVKDRINANPEILRKHNMVVEAK